MVQAAREQRPGQADDTYRAWLKDIPPQSPATTQSSAGLAAQFEAWRARQRSGTRETAFDSAAIELRQPSASEVFALRSKCVELGDKILEENFIGSALAHSQDSRYDARSNRCYVKLTVHEADLDHFDDYNNTILYDGWARRSESDPFAARKVIHLRA
jgi:hypothetical protein